MILLLDAHCLLWALAQPDELRVDARAALEDPANTVLVSAGTLWEVEIKRVAGRLIAPDDVLSAIEEIGVATLPVTGEDAVRAARLPRKHADPFDRLVIAQAQRLGAVVVTRDRAMQAYDVAVLPA